MTLSPELAELSESQRARVVLLNLTNDRNLAELEYNESRFKYEKLKDKTAGQIIIVRQLSEKEGI